jgi:hypothetical protein
MPLFRVRLLAVLVLPMLFVLVPVGCSATTPQGVADLIDRGEAARSVVQAERDRLAELLPAAATGTPEHADVTAALAASDARLALLDAAIARARAALAEAERPTDALTITAQTIAAALPEPLGPTLLLGSALLVSLARARQLKNGAASIARSIEKAAETDPEFSAAIVRQATLLRSIQTPTAARIVDQVQAGGPRLPI